MAIKELKRHNVIRTNNVVGELGEYLAIEIYNNTPGLPNLMSAPVGTENIDAISRKGDRYSIKSTSNTTTGVFYGLEEPGLEVPDRQRFEYVIVCKFDDDYELQMVLEMDWDTFLRNKRKFVWFFKNPSALAGMSVGANISSKFNRARC